MDLLEANETTAGWKSLDNFKDGGGGQEDQAMIRQLEILAPQGEGRS